MALPEGSSIFLIGITGQVSSISMPEHTGHLYARIQFTAGQDWTITAGQVEGLSQLVSCEAGSDAVLNLPFDLTYKSTSPFGWPKLVVSVYEMSTFGKELVLGYGWTHVPLSTGTHCRSVPLFRPDSSSLLQKISQWLLNQRPEFVDVVNSVGSAENRELVRVVSGGEMRLQFNIAAKDLHRLGYIIDSNKGTVRSSSTTASATKATIASMPLTERPADAKSSNFNASNNEVSKKSVEVEGARRVSQSDIDPDAIDNVDSDHNLLTD